MRSVKTECLVLFYSMSPHTIKENQRSFYAAVVISDWLIEVDKTIKQSAVQCSGAENEGD
jgi:hypothetical protein